MTVAATNPSDLAGMNEIAKLARKLLVIKTLANPRTGLLLAQAAIAHMIGLGIGIPDQANQTSSEIAAQGAGNVPLDLLTVVGAILNCDFSAGRELGHLARQIDDAAVRACPYRTEAGPRSTSTRESV